MKNAIKFQSATGHSVIAASLMALVCAVSAGAAQASEQFQPLTRIVSYADLNLDSAAGAKALYGRLHNAAHYVCSPYDGREMRLLSRWEACVNSAIAAAVVQINKPMLTALHRPGANRSSTG